jgi:hypothetical protein
MEERARRPARWVVFAFGIYVGMGAVTALMAAPAEKLADQASAPAGVLESVWCGFLWPAMLPGFLHSMRHPER